MSFLNKSNVFFLAIKLGMKSLLAHWSLELTRNKTAELYLATRDAGDSNYYLSVMIPALLGK